MIDRGEAIRKVVLNGVRWSGLSRLYRAISPGSGAILMLHRVTSAQTSPLGFNRHLSVTPDFLDCFIGELKSDGYRFVSMDELATRMEAGQGVDGLLALTADDAYRDNLLEALPVLEKHQAPMTIYAAPAQISMRVCLWWSTLEEIIAEREGFYLNCGGSTRHFDCSSMEAKRQTYVEMENWLTTSVPEEQQNSIMRELISVSGHEPEQYGNSLLMTWNELRMIANNPLVTIGAHTVHHYNLRRLSEQDALREMSDAADILELELGKRPVHMAYPYGYVEAVGPREVELATRVGYHTAVTTRHGLVTASHKDHMRSLPRISINGRYQSLEHLRTMLTGITTPIANRGKRLVTV